MKQTLYFDVKMNNESILCDVYQNGSYLPGYLRLIYPKYQVIEPSIMIGGHPGGQISMAMAVIELLDGQIIETFATSIKVRND